MRLDIAYFAKNRKLKTIKKKSFFDYYSLLKLLFTCLFALHEQCNRRWFKKKKKPEMRMRKPNKHVV